MYITIKTEATMPRVKTDRVRKSLYISAEQWEKLGIAARKEDLSAADIVRRAISEYLRKEEKDV
jgi:hypothetical protein